GRSRRWPGRGARPGPAPRTHGSGARWAPRRRSGTGPPRRPRRPCRGGRWAGTRGGSRAPRRRPRPPRGHGRVRPPLVGGRSQLAVGANSSAGFVEKVQFRPRGVAVVGAGLERAPFAAAGEAVLGLVGLA